MDKNKKKKERDVLIDISANAVMSTAVDSFELVNKYGTYEIQPTADSDHDFPKIAQGLPKPENRKVLDTD